MDFKLRPWRLDDIDSLVENANDPDIAKNLTDGFPYPYTREHGLRFIENASRDRPIKVFAIEVNGKAVGGIGIHPQQDIMKKNAELGYWLGKKYWGKGIVTAAVKEIVKYGFDTFPITRIYARPFGTNNSSQRVLEKAGFTLEAHIKNNIYKNGEFLDEMIYAVRHHSV